MGRERKNNDPVGLDPLFYGSPLITVANKQFLSRGKPVGGCEVIVIPE